MFPVHTKESAPEKALPLMDAAASTFGFVPNLLGIMASSPALAEAYLALSGIFEKSTALTAAERQVVLLTVSRYHQCHYCMAAHSMAADMQNVAPDIINAIRNDLPISDPKLEALRHLATMLVECRGLIPEQELKAFLDAGYQASHVLDVMVGVGQKTLSNYTNHLAKTPLDAALESHAWSP
jgi:uncharacterized peroxidase-related enzyme